PRPPAPAADIPPVPPLPKSLPPRLSQPPIRTGPAPGTLTPVRKRPTPLSATEPRKGRVLSSGSYIPAPKRQLEPIALPPINIQALPTPTVRKVNSMLPKAPSPQKLATKTGSKSPRAPTTPLTASKSSFHDTGCSSIPLPQRSVSSKAICSKSRKNSLQTLAPAPDTARPPSSDTPRRRISVAWLRKDPKTATPPPKYNAAVPLPPMPDHRLSNSTDSILSATSSPAADLDAVNQEVRRVSSRRKLSKVDPEDLDLLQARAVPNSPMTPSEAIKKYSSMITLYERGELTEYQEIHTLGHQSAKTRGNDISPDRNFGFDDDRGDYLIVSGDHLAYRFEIVDILGKGSFGQVVRCFDRRNGGLSAVKIIRNKKRFHQQALVEVKILQDLNSWDLQNKHNLVRFTQHFYFRGHLCIATELLGINLYQFIKANDFRGSSINLIRAFTRQMLNTLVLMRKHRIIHCDLKPENVLLVHPFKSDIKVIDFGSSCFENEKVYTYIQSRFYRSPEVILGMSYGMAIDMWSLGCILSELHTGYPLFPGENEQEQLACIMEVFGPPDKHLIEKSTRKKLFFDSSGKPRPFVSSKNKRRRPMSKTLAQVLKTEDLAFLDFVNKCLLWNPDHRLRPDEALCHEYITGIKLDKVHASSSSAVGTTHRPLPQPPRLTHANKGASITKIPISPYKKSLPNSTASQQSLSARPRIISTSYSSPNIRSANQYTAAVSSGQPIS
ncbi:Dual specificity protein kinase pom1, partial [Neolecta irregularis DAH-3]